jgi:hypothetical protein
MSDWPRTSGSRVSAFGVDTSTSDGVSVTASGTANTKGAWTELIPSTGHSATAIEVSFNHSSLLSGTFLLDIGIGASGSETVLVPDLLFSGNWQGFPAPALLPITVPAGTRLSARVACSTASAVARVSGHLFTGGFDAPSPRSLITAYGVNAAGSNGTSVDPGATAHTKGAWTQIAASTSAVARTLLVGIGIGNNAAVTTATWLCDVAVGASGSEQILIPDYHVNVAAIETIGPSLSPPIPVSVPAGSRLAARAQCITDATDRLLFFILYGVS